MTREYNMPAFATPPIYNPNTGDYIHGQPGMDLRDWFAGKILSGWCSNPGDGFNGPYADMAREAYRLADAMLDARAKGGNDG